MPEAAEQDWWYINQCNFY